MYADDVSLWASPRCKESASADIQQAVDCFGVEQEEEDDSEHREK